MAINPPVMVKTITDAQGQQWNYHLVVYVEVDAPMNEVRAGVDTYKDQQSFLDGDQPRRRWYQVLDAAFIQSLPPGKQPDQNTRFLKWARNRLLQDVPTWPIEG